MSRLRVLVADDEPLAREMVQAMVECDAELQVVGGASDGKTAAREIRQLEPDIVLLDIEMPEASGIEAVRSLDSDRQPVFIFVTAHDQYATEAFEVEALDYVLKPVSQARLSEALDRAKRRIRELRMSAVAEKVASLTASLGGKTRAGRRVAPSDYLRRLPISTGGRTRFIEADDIVWIESQDYYVRLHTHDGSPLVRVTLKSLNARLDPSLFCQVRRGAIVNVGEVTEVQKLFKGAHALLLSDGTQLRISRSRWRQVREILAPRLRRR